MRFNCGRTGGDGGGSSGADPVDDDGFEPSAGVASAPAGLGAAGACDGSVAVVIGPGVSLPAGAPSGTADSLPRRRALGEADRGMRPGGVFESTACRTGAEPGTGPLRGAAASGSDGASVGAACAGAAGAGSTPAEAAAAPGAAASADGASEISGGCVGRGTSFGREAGRGEDDPAPGAALLAPPDSGAPRSGASASGLGTSNAMPWPVSCA